MQRRRAELVLLVCGSSLLIKGGWGLARYVAFQAQPEWYVRSPGFKVQSSQERVSALPIALHSSSGLQNVSELHVLGRLEVPRLGMSVLMVEGDDDRELALAAGHVEGTADLGSKGNAVVAGHRDTSFWPLQKIRIGDRVKIRSGRTYEYVVRSIRIVDPDDTKVLENTTDRTLTMVTCYPFRYFGSAPKRFVVQAGIP